MSHKKNKWNCPCTCTIVVDNWENENNVHALVCSLLTHTMKPMYSNDFIDLRKGQYREKYVL